MPVTVISRLEGVVGLDLPDGRVLKLRFDYQRLSDALPIWGEVWPVKAVQDATTRGDAMRLARAAAAGSVEPIAADDIAALRPPLFDLGAALVEALSFAYRGAGSLEPDEPDDEGDARATPDPRAGRDRPALSSRKASRPRSKRG